MSYRQGGPGLHVGWWVAMFVAVLVVSQLIALSIPEQRAYDTAEGLGYSDVTVTGSSTIFPGLQGCGKDDLRVFFVTGTAPDGVVRDFIVCAGLFKGGTPRF